MLTHIRRRISLLNYKFGFIKKSFGNNSFRLLDIGAGNHSASKTCFIFPTCRYFGVDLNKYYNNDQRDFEAAEKFYEIDLVQLDYRVIPDNGFDFIRMTHVIEHLINGDQVIINLLQKLEEGGYIYIEYPSRRSTRLPSMHGTLNFYDDPTHVRIYSLAEIRALLTSHGCIVLEGGTRRNWWNILAMPVRIIASLITTGKLQGNIFWDLFGFAEYVYARKNPLLKQ
jgi:SAM-dependent methyltransferase